MSDNRAWLKQQVAEDLEKTARQELQNAEHSAKQQLKDLRQTIHNLSNKAAEFAAACGQATRIATQTQAREKLNQYNIFAIVGSLSCLEQQRNDVAEQMRVAHQAANKLYSLHNKARDANESMERAICARMQAVKDAQRALNGVNAVMKHTVNNFKKKLQPKTKDEEHEAVEKKSIQQEENVEKEDYNLSPHSKHHKNVTVDI